MSSPLARRRRAVLLVAAVAAVSSLAGMGASLLIRSPQQNAAEAKGPGPTTLTALVDRRVLQDSVLIRGTVTASRTVEVSPGATEGRSAVITSVRVKAGQSIRAGQVLMEVSGRPIFVLPGAKPAFRDLLPGSQGDDVAQLQAALRSLGYRTDGAGAVFGPATKRALAAFYDRIGYAAPTSSVDGAALNAAQDGVVQAERTVEDSRSALRTAQGNAVPRARTALVRAAEDLARARRYLSELDARSGPTLPLSEAVFLPSFPARVEKVSAAIGATVKGAPITLSSGKLVVKAAVNTVQRNELAVGMKARIGVEDSSSPVAGKITDIGELETTADGGGFSHAVTVSPDRPLPATLGGRDVVLTVERKTTAGPVLVVPESALYATADGASSILRLRQGDAQDRVPVDVTATGNGYAAVVAVGGYGLQPGDRVLIGVPKGSAEND